MHVQLLDALIASTPTRGVPAVPPPLPLTPLLLSGVSTAFVGWVSSKLYFMAALGTGVRAWWGSAPFDDLRKERGRVSAGGRDGETPIAGVKPEANGDK